MKTRTEKILVVMNVLSWITFIGLMVQAGSILVPSGIILFNPEAAKYVYMGQNLYPLRQFSHWHYTTMVSFMIAIPALEAYTAYLVIKVLSKIKLANPFTIEVAQTLERISYLIFATWVIAMLSNGYTTWLVKQVPGLPENLISGEFIFLAGVVFVFAQIFKKGVEIQSENELIV